MPNQGNLGGGQGIGLVDEVAEGALQGQGFGGEGAGGRDGEGAFVPQRVKAGGGLVSIMRTAREGDKPWQRSSTSTGRIYGLTRMALR